MRTPSRRSCLVMFAATAALFTSCSATGKFKYVGEPPIWESDLPAPEESIAVPGTVKIVLHCPTLEDDEDFAAELRARVVAQCREAGLGDLELLRDRSKKAQYEVIVYEAGEDGRFEFNAEAGALAGIGTGVATGILTDSIGAGFGAAAIGGVAIGALLGEKKAVYAFAGVCRQYTSAEGTRTLEASSRRALQGGGGIVDDATDTQTDGGTGREAIGKSHFDLATNKREVAFLFHIAVTGDPLSSKSTRDEAAMGAFVKRFPAYVTGGTVL